ncbi:hypothetical protein ACTPEF_23530, partial [Clostridioides difficile]
SSMANVCNRMLGKNIFTAIDMPIDATIADVSKQMSRYLEGDRDTSLFHFCFHNLNLKEFYLYVAF